MRGKFKPGDYTLLAVILIVGLLYTANFYGPGVPYNSATIEDSVADHTSINDSLPHYAWKRIEDSIQLAEACMQSRAGKIRSSGYVMFTGFAHVREQDICFSQTQTDKYYLALAGYQLAHDAEFYTRGGKFFLKHVVWDDKTGRDWKGHYKHTETGVRFEPDQKIGTGPIVQGSTGSVLLPVSKANYNLIRVLTYTGMAMLGICGLIIVIWLPLRVLYAIASRNMFTMLTVRDLLIIGWGLIGLSLLPGVYSFAANRIFASQIPPEIYFPFPGVLLQNKGLLLAGLIVLLLARAFKKGLNLKEYNDLIKEENAVLKEDLALNI